jgi:uncharacterized protein (DUF2141 family)
MHFCLASYPFSMNVPVPVLVLFMSLVPGVLVNIATPREEPLADTATVRVCVNSAQSDNGRVVVALFKSADGFPREKEKAAYTASAPIEADSASVRVAGVVEGDYAIFAFHDADGNGTLNTNWAGMPKEGIALSNWTGGRPTFDDSTIEVRSDTTIDLSFYYR